MGSGSGLVRAPTALSEDCLVRCSCCFQGASAARLCTRPRGGSRVSARLLLSDLCEELLQGAVDRLLLSDLCEELLQGAADSSRLSKRCSADLCPTAPARTLTSLPVRVTSGPRAVVAVPPEEAGRAASLSERFPGSHWLRATMMAERLGLRSGLQLLQLQLSWSLLYYPKRLRIETVHRPTAGSMSYHTYTCN